MVHVIKEVHVNIPLLTMLTINPKYALILKDLEAHTHNVGDIDCMEKMVVDGHYCTIKERKLPPKMKDLVSFVQTCDIENINEIKGLSDLGSNIDLMCQVSSRSWDPIE